MSASDNIKTAMKAGKAIIGYKETIKFLKSGGEAKAVIVSNNIPANMDSDIRQSAKASGIEIENFEGTSKDLGTACGKPFPVSAVVIKV